MIRRSLLLAVAVAFTSAGHAQEGYGRAPVHAPQAASNAEFTGPAAGTIAGGWIEPRLARLSEAALRLQNAVVEQCSLPNETSQEFMRAAFGDTVRAAAALAPFAVGSAAARESPARLTSGIDTAFSRSRLEDMMAGRAEPPATLPRLQAQDPALAGLPALERLLLFKDYPAGQPLRRRCMLAQTVAAAIRRTAVDVVTAWESGERDPQWSGEPVELADRMRLRDLVQAQMDVAVRAERELERVVHRGGPSGIVSFAARCTAVVYTTSLIEAMAAQSDLIAAFAPPGSEAAAQVAAARAGLTDALAALREEPAAGRDPMAVLAPYREARSVIVQELPRTFGFDPDAFATPLGIPLLGTGEVPAMID